MGIPAPLPLVFRPLLKNPAQCPSVHLASSMSISVLSLHCLFLALGPSLKFLFCVQGQEFKGLSLKTPLFFLGNSPTRDIATPHPPVFYRAASSTALSPLSMPGPFIPCSPGLLVTTELLNNSGVQLCFSELTPRNILCVLFTSYSDENCMQLKSSRGTSSGPCVSPVGRAICTHCK
jgi:hypothetical protein